MNQNDVWCISECGARLGEYKNGMFEFKIFQKKIVVLSKVVFVLVYVVVVFFF